VGLFLFLLYGIIVGPMKAARRAYYWSFGGARWTWSFVALMDTIVWLVVAVTLFCLAVHNFPQVCQAIESLPALANQAVTDIKAWWHIK
jgi:hypothetical protein